MAITDRSPVEIRNWFSHTQIAGGVLETLRRENRPMTGIEIERMLPDTVPNRCLRHTLAIMLCGGAVHLSDDRRRVTIAYPGRCYLRLLITLGTYIPGRTA